MTTTIIANPQYCILMRSGVEVWATKEKAAALVALLKSGKAPEYIEYEDRLFNTSQIAGIFTAADMEAKTRRQNGQWQCRFQSWHDRGQKCECSDPAKTSEREQYNNDFYREHGYYPPHAT